MYNEKVIGERISQLRERKGLSRTQLAENMIVSVQAIGKWERGESLPDIITLKKLADILETDINNFFVNKIDKSIDNSDMQAKIDMHKPEWNLSASNWKNADFSGLKNIAEKFKGSNVIGCKFVSSDLSGIAFGGNNIKGCDFLNANLSKSKLSMSNIPNNNFSGANFQNSVIKMCDIHGCDFSGANFSGTKISGTAVNRNSLKGAIWLATSFSSSTLVNVTVDSDITDCSFVNCTFKNVEFSSVTLCNTFFKNQKLKKVKFTNCRADKITYSFLKHTGADLSGIQIMDA